MPPVKLGGALREVGALPEPLGFGLPGCKCVHFLREAQSYICPTLKHRSKGFHGADTIFSIDHKSLITNIEIDTL